MSILFRKEKDKDKDSREQTGVIREAEGENTAPKEEMTDISAAAEAAGQEPGSDMEEIYSTRNKRVKYRRVQPLEAEAAAKRREAAKDELKKGKLEFSMTEEKAPEVKLEAELDPDAKVSGEIIEDIVDVKKLRNIYVEDIDDIDVSLDPMEGIREYGRLVNDREHAESEQKPEPKTKPEPEYVPSGETVVTRIPVYKHSSKVDKIYLKAGRFTDVVESEYDEYLQSTDPAISKSYHAMTPQVKPHQSLLYTLSQVAARRKSEMELKHKNKDIMRNNFDEDGDKPKKPKKEKPEKTEKAEADKPANEGEQPESKKADKPKKPSPIAKFFRVTGAMITARFSAPSESEKERSLDYNSHEDEKYIFERTGKNRRKLTIQLLLTAALAIVMIALVIWERTCAVGAVAERGGGVTFIYCGTSLIFTLLLGLVSRQTLVDGLKPLRRFKGNSSTLISLAYIGCVLQGLISLFTSTSFAGGDNHLYGFIVALALLLHTAGRLMMVMRVQSNFDFISSRSPAYVAKLFEDDETARRMVSGTTASKGTPAYQHMTRFLSDYLRISYAPDPSEELSGKLAPIAIVGALFVAILYAILFKSVTGTVSALTVMLCIGIPFTSMLAGNLPMLLFSRRMLEEDAMVAGYPSIRRFGDTCALMMNACDLFPADCVSLEELVPLMNYRVEDNLVMAAAVLREARSPIAPVFDELINEYGGFIPSVESVMYEDKSGLVGWINGERVLIGNLTLMNRYHVTVPDDNMASRGRETAYVAVSGQAVAVLCLSYSAPLIIKQQIQSAERNGLTLVVSTTDANITPELIVSRYELFYRSVKVTAPGYSDIIDESTTKVEETSRAYLATRGRIGSLARAIGGCIGIKSNINLGIAISVFGMMLGILLCATLALYASVARLSVIELLIYIGFWVSASIIAELIRKP